MRLGVLVFALLTMATLAALPARADGSCRGGWCDLPHAQELADRPEAMAAVPPDGQGVVVLRKWDDWLGETPWHYHLGPEDCPPPYCLPSYHRHRERVVIAHPLPIAVVLQRLRHLDYDGFTTVFLDGANYQIDARNRYGRPVRLFVSAGTGLLRQQIILPTY